MILYGSDSVLVQYYKISRLFLQSTTNSSTTSIYYYYWLSKISFKQNKLLHGGAAITSLNEISVVRNRGLFPKYGMLEHLVGVAKTDMIVNKFNLFLDKKGPQRQKGISRRAHL